MLSLNQIKKQVLKLVKELNAPKNIIPTFNMSIDFGHPHIEVDDDGYHYVIIERGQIIEKRTSKDINDLLYWIFEGITFEMALEYELKNRIPNVDVRHLLFKKQLELLNRINNAFVERKKNEMEEILRNNPYID